MEAISRAWVFCVAGAGVVLCTLALVYPVARDQNPLTLAVGSWPGAETLEMARGANPLLDKEINFVEMSWSSAVMIAFEKRVVDVSIVSLDEMLRLESGGHHPRAILVLGISKGGDAILSRPEVTSLEGLRGKRVGVELRASGEYLLARALDGVGMKLSDVNLIPINTTESEPGYVENDFDAVVVADPWRTRLLAKGARTLYTCSGLGNEMTRVLIVRADDIAASKARLKLAVNGYFGVLQAMNEAKAKENWRPSVLRREDLDSHQFTEAMRLIHLPAREENVQLLGEGPKGLAGKLQTMAVFMRRHGLLLHEVNVRELLDNRFVSEGGNS